MNPQFYGFRWITLLLSQEFDLPEVIQLWDCLFSDENRFQFLLYCCCAMISYVKLISIILLLTIVIYIF